MKTSVAEKIARRFGWVAEVEHNGERDGVRHPASGNWSENWRGACAQIADGEYALVAEPHAWQRDVSGSWP